MGGEGRWEKERERELGLVCEMKKVEKIFDL